MKPRLSRVLAIRDTDGQWYLRRVKTVIQDDIRGMKIYECDKHLGGPYESARTAEEKLNRKRKKTKP